MTDKIWSEVAAADGSFSFAPGERYAVLASVDKSYSLADVEKYVTGQGFSVTYAWQEGQASRATYPIDDWLQKLPPDTTSGQRWLYAEGNFTGASAWSVNQDPSFVQRLVIGRAYHVAHVFQAVDAPATAPSTSTTTTTTETPTEPSLPETTSSEGATPPASGAVFFVVLGICGALVGAAWGLDVALPRLLSKAA